MSKEEKYKQVLIDIAAMPLAGNRTAKTDKANYEMVVRMARNILVPHTLSKGDL